MGIGEIDTLDGATGLNVLRTMNYELKTNNAEPTAGLEHRGTLTVSLALCGKHINSSYTTRAKNSVRQKGDIHIWILSKSLKLSSSVAGLLSCSPA
jgi:hypothetical protein